MSRFDYAFDIIIGVEGGYSNDPEDNGGETKYGISKRAYPNLDIKNLTLDHAKEIYRKDYWNASSCDVLPEPLDLYVFDCAVNQGVSTAVKTLQKVLGLVQDGSVGPKTISAARQADEEDAAMYMAERALKYTSYADFKVYGKGWFKRLFHVSAK